MDAFNFNHELMMKHSSSYNTNNPLDPEEFRRQGHMIIDFLADYYLNIEKYPVLSQVEPGYLRKLLPESTPYNPESIETILQDVQDHILPGVTHWQSPSYFAYFPSSGSIAGFLGEMLSTGFNVVGFNWISSPAATELESIVMDWLGEMLQLPKSFLFSGNGGGVLQGTTCEAILCTLVAARDQMLCRIGSQNMGKLVVYGSDQTHCSLQKAARIAGINPSNFRAIKTTKRTAFSLSPDSLRSAICKDIDAGLIPLFLCATVGTTSTTAIDPLKSLCDVAKDYGLWVHVDAAYAGSVCICPEFRHVIDGVEGANSFSLNAHKWFLTTLDCCCLWVKDPSALVKSLSTNPEYLRNKATDSRQVVDYKDWQLTLSRRFRSLKLWFVLRSYGVAKLRDFLRSHVNMAKLFEGFVTSDKRFEIVVPRSFAVVCFRVLSPGMGNGVAYAKRTTNGHTNGHLNGHTNGHTNGHLNGHTNGHLNGLTNGKGDDHDHDDHNYMKEASTNELNRKLLESINKSGRVYMTHSMVGGVFVIRFAVGATLVEEKHVITAWKVVQEHANAILSKNY
ncbi:tyrosine decarboxylase-like [Juglans microcarpa x Juglans regia]|uniref:tyrosine decarboxylase-like n=1 Tax=Juglans microcarpa x Juglans regia TaxID=2249226 RepID=UPI001B7ECEEE|nr:tyrosine decarboxylase-like [Juglans microcarpa x Juglans regia]